MRHFASILWISVLFLLCGCGGGGTSDVQPTPPPPPPPPPPAASVLYTFAGGEDGANPYGLIRDDAGNLYGTTFKGGDPACPEDANGCGTVFKLDSSGAFTTLHIFAGGPMDGANPRAGMIRDAAGNIYGSTFGGGSHQSGIVFKLDVTGSESVLYHFTGRADGAAPEVGIRDAAGNLYGTTGFNDVLVKCSHQCGTVFKLDPAGKLTTLHTFTGQDGDSPSGPLIADAVGNLYGGTGYGGDNLDCIHPLGCGTVFKLDPSGALTTLYAFAGAEAEGEVPWGRLTRDETDILYGTTIGGGVHLGGTVFKLDANSQLTTLHTFVAADGGEPTDDPGGQNPQGGVLRDTAGNLYGTTSQGGKHSWGVVFGLNESDVESVLLTFTQEGGGYPLGPLVGDSAGNLYGTGFAGGNLSCHPPFGCGIVFKLRLP